jgi:hypothetical protein
MKLSVMLALVSATQAIKIEEKSKAAMKIQVKAVMKVQPKATMKI